MKRTRSPLPLLLFATLAAGAGNGVTIVAFPWLALQRNGSAADAAVVAMAGTVPLLASTLLAGAAEPYPSRPIRVVAACGNGTAGCSPATRGLPGSAFASAPGVAPSRCRWSRAR